MIQFTAAPIPIPTPLAGVSSRKDPATTTPANWTVRHGLVGDVPVDHENGSITSCSVLVKVGSVDRNDGADDAVGDTHVGETPAQHRVTAYVINEENGMYSHDNAHDTRRQ